MDDLEKACIKYLGRDPFLIEMRGYCRYGGRLSAGQRAAVLRHLREPDANKETAGARTPTARATRR